MSSEAKDKEAILIPVQKYIDAVLQSNPDLIAEAFHTDATMSIYFGDDVSVVPAIDTIVSYMKSVPPTSESSPKFAGRILSVERAGKMASVKIAEDELEGMNFTTFFSRRHGRR